MLSSVGQTEQLLDDQGSIHVKRASTHIAILLTTLTNPLDGRLQAYLINHLRLVSSSAALFNMANSPASLIQPSSPSFNPRFRCSNSQPPRLRKALSFILLLACLATTALAQSETQHPAITSSTSLAAPASTDVSDGQGPSARAATSNWNILRKQLRKRKDQDVETSSTTKSSETKKGSATTTTLTISIEQPTSSSSSNSSPLPQAFDGNLASEFSSTAGSKCPAFLNSLLASPSFETCYPLSMLIQVSHD